MNTSPLDAARKLAPQIRSAADEIDAAHELLDSIRDKK